MGSEGNTKAEMGGTGGTMDGAGLRQTKLEGGWTVHKTQEDKGKKMRGQNGGEPKQMVKAGRREKGGTERMKGVVGGGLQRYWQYMHHDSNREEETLNT